MDLRWSLGKKICDKPKPARKQHETNQQTPAGLIEDNEGGRSSEQLGSFNKRVKKMRKNIEQESDWVALTGMLSALRLASAAFENKAGNMPVGYVWMDNYEDTVEVTDAREVPIVFSIGANGPGVVPSTVRFNDVNGFFDTEHPPDIVPAYLMVK